MTDGTSLPRGMVGERRINERVRAARRGAAIPWDGRPRPTAGARVDAARRTTIPPARRRRARPAVDRDLHLVVFRLGLDRGALAVVIRRRADPLEPIALPDLRASVGVSV